MPGGATGAAAARARRAGVRPPDAPLAAEEAERPLAPGRRARILLVDDEEMFTATLADILEDHGYAVETASSGSQALSLVRECRPALMFLDLTMPGMTGEDVCRRLQADRLAPTVVVLTAMASEKQIRRLRRLGARAVLIKPVSVTSLLEIARSVCGPGAPWLARA